MFEIFAKKGLRDVNLGSEEKTSDLAAHFSRNSGAANTVFISGFSWGADRKTLSMLHICWTNTINH